MNSLEPLAAPEQQNVPGRQTYTWVGSEWSECSKLCEGGVQSRTVACFQSDGSSVNDSLCPASKPSVTQACNSQMCTKYMWIQSGFGPCSATCGGGTQSQDVTCKNDSGELADNGQCDHPKPATSRACNTQTCPAPTVACEANPLGISVGAIRWDGWYGGGVAQSFGSKTLAPSKYWSRRPFFAPPSMTPINGNSPAIMQAEIDYAVKAGLDYWAFLEYPIGSWPASEEMNVALENYLANSQTQLKFSLILSQFSYKVGISAASKDYLSQTVNRLADSRYLKVKIDGVERPLVYVFFDSCSGEARLKYCSPWMYQEISSRYRAKMGSDPYYIYMIVGDHPNPQQIADAKYLGMHGLTTYAPVANANNVAFTDFAKGVRLTSAESMRVAAGNAGLDLVPFASAGWDPSPRFECVAAGLCGSSVGAYGNQFFSATGSAAEVAQHIYSVGEWAHYQAQAPRAPYNYILNRAKTMIVYAWNEHDEGGWLNPTRTSDGEGIDTSRVDALGALLRNCH